MTERRKKSLNIQNFYMIYQNFLKFYVDSCQKKILFLPSSPLPTLVQLLFIHVEMPTILYFFNTLFRCFVQKNFHGSYKIISMVRAKRFPWFVQKDFHQRYLETISEMS